MMIKALNRTKRWIPSGLRCSLLPSFDLNFVTALLPLPFPVPSFDQSALSPRLTPFRIFFFATSRQGRNAHLGGAPGLAPVISLFCRKT